MSLPARITLLQFDISPAMVIADPAAVQNSVPEFFSSLVVGSFPLGATVSGGMGVMQSAGGVVPAMTDTLAEAAAFVGIAQQAGTPPGNIAVVSYGPISDTGWNWTAYQPVYLADNGGLTQTAPSAGISLTVGFSLAPTEIFVRPLSPIQL